MTPQPVSEGTNGGSRIRKQWKRVGNKITGRGTAITIINIVAIIAIASGIGVEAVHALASPGTGASTTTTTTAPAGGSGSGSGGSGSDGATAVQLGAPVFLRGAGYAPGHGAFDAVDCDSTTHCLAVGADGLDKGVIAVSDDGGMSWSNQSVPSGTPPLNAVSCSDVKHCVAVGQGSIASTSDGGQTWSLQAPPSKKTTLLGVTCAANGNCLSVGVAPPPVSGPYLGEVLTSTDNGADWSATQLASGTPGVGAVACPSAGNCISVGATIMLTTDGGATWSQVAVAGGTPALTAIVCSSAQQCVAVGPNPAALSNAAAPALVVVTHDGGQTWADVAMAPGTASLDNVACAAGGQCYMSGPAGQPTDPAPVYATTDGGDSWQQSATPGTLTAVAAIACPAANHCVIVGRHGAQPEVDATTTGSSWSSQTLPMSVVTGPLAANTPNS